MQGVGFRLWGLGFGVEAVGSRVQMHVARFLGGDLKQPITRKHHSSVSKPGAI